MAKVIIGGQMLSLLLALLVTPVTYSLLDSWTNLFRRGKAQPSLRRKLGEPSSEPVPATVE